MDGAGLSQPALPVLLPAFPAVAFLTEQRASAILQGAGATHR